MVQSIYVAADWQAVLRELAGQSPPGGSAPDLDSHVERLMREHPDQFLSTTTRLVQTTRPCIPPPPQASTAVSRWLSITLGSLEDRARSASRRCSALVR